MIVLSRWLRPVLFAVIMTVLLVALFHTPQFGRLYYPYRYRQIIETNAKRYGVDPLLVAAVMRVESKYNPDAVSSKGAMGLMQIMPSTADWIAAQVGIEELTAEMIMDPEINIQLGTWYLANLSKEFEGRLDVVIAAYNGGRGQVSTWLAEGIWDGSYEGRDNIPFSETRHFLFKVKTAYSGYTSLYSKQTNF